LKLHEIRREIIPFTTEQKSIKIRYTLFTMSMHERPRTHGPIATLTPPEVMEVVNYIGNTELTVAASATVAVARQPIETPYQLQDEIVGLQGTIPAWRLGGKAMILPLRAAQAAPDALPEETDPNKRLDRIFAAGGALMDWTRGQKLSVSLDAVLGPKYAPHLGVPALRLTMYDYMLSAGAPVSAGEMAAELRVSDVRVAQHFRVLATRGIVDMSLYKVGPKSTATISPDYVEPLADLRAKLSWLSVPGGPNYFWDVAAGILGTPRKFYALIEKARYQHEPGFRLDEKRHEIDFALLSVAAKLGPVSTAQAVETITENTGYLINHDTIQAALTRLESEGRLQSEIRRRNGKHRFYSIGKA
jgi:hypothetical protein